MNLSILDILEPTEVSIFANALIVPFLATGILLMLVFESLTQDRYLLLAFLLSRMAMYFRLILHILYPSPGFSHFAHQP